LFYLSDFQIILIIISLWLYIANILENLYFRYRYYIFIIIYRNFRTNLLRNFIFSRNYIYKYCCNIFLRLILFQDNAFLNHYFTFEILHLKFYIYFTFKILVYTFHLFVHICQYIIRANLALHLWIVLNINVHIILS